MNFQDFRNISKAFESADIEAVAYFPKNLTASEAVLSDKEREEGVIVVDIADDSTQLTIWKNGFLAGTRALRHGGRNLTLQVAETWKIETYDAERVKEGYGSMHLQSEFGEELIPLVERHDKVNRHIKRQAFQEKFLEHCDGWMNTILKEVDNFVDDEKILYPHYVFTGGSAAIDGFLEFLQQRFKRDGRLGVTRAVEAANELKVDPSLTAALGMYRWLATHDQDQKRLLEPHSFFEKTMASARDWFLTYF